MALPRYFTEALHPETLGVLEPVIPAHGKHPAPGLGWLSTAPITYCRTRIDAKRGWSAAVEKDNEASWSGGGGAAHGGQGCRGGRGPGAGGLDDLGHAGCGAHEFRLHAPLSLT